MASESGYNKVFLVGRVARDPEMRLTPSGIAVSTFSVAVDKPKRKGEPDPGADFIRIVTWRRLAEICHEYLKKGKLVAIEGRLQFSSFEREGVSRQSAEVIADSMQMLDRGSPELVPANPLDSPVS